MMFSHVASHLPGETNPFYQLRRELEAAGHTLVDLVSGNVNDHGILFPPELLEDILLQSARTSRVYRPDSFGQAQARHAISEYYGTRGGRVDPGSIVLTPGTSIAYWYCFKLLTNDGDEILCPRPSYPLFDYIAALSGARLVSYDLAEKNEWALDLDRLESCISTRTRAIVLISPHNPTGHVASVAEIEGLADLASRHNLALIVDEVFSEFAFSPGSIPIAMSTQAPLVFTLNGFSKMFALPGMKLGWMVISGAEPLVKQALRSLEIISDTFLPVSEIAQAAAPRIFTDGKDFLQSYVREIRARRHDTSEQLMTCHRCSFSPPQGGFYLTLRLRDLSEDRAAEALLRNGHLLTHPGYFYDMDPHHLVLSFVQSPEISRAALARLAAILNGLET
jgi:alanine-synthesizing transaminase